MYDASVGHLHGENQVPQGLGLLFHEDSQTEGLQRLVDGEPAAEGRRLHQRHLGRRIHLRRCDPNAKINWTRLFVFERNGAAHTQGAGRSSVLQTHEQGPAGDRMGHQTFLAPEYRHGKVAYVSQHFGVGQDLLRDWPGPSRASNRTARAIDAADRRFGVNVVNRVHKPAVCVFGLGDEIEILRLAVRP